MNKTFHALVSNLVPQFNSMTIPMYINKTVKMKIFPFIITKAEKLLKLVK